MADILGAGAAFLGGTSGGSANVQTLSYIYPSGYAKQVGAPVSFVAGFTNSGAATLNVLGSGAVAIRRGTPAGPVALSGGEIFAGQAYVVMFDGTYYVLLNPSFNPVLGPGSATSGHVAVFSGTSGALLADGGSIAGRIAQPPAYFQTGSFISCPTNIPLDDTIPQNTEGDQVMSLVFTPVNAASILEITVTGYGASSVANVANIIALFQDAIASALACGVWLTFSGAPGTSFKFLMVAGTTSAITFKVRAGAQSGTLSFNGTGGGRLFGGVFASGISVVEYLP